jgi:cytochrome P450
VSGGYGEVPAASTYGPVTDWASDLDHVDPRYNRDAPSIWRGLVDSGCPVAHSERYGGMWAPLTHALVSEVAYDTEHFSSRGVVVSRAKADDFMEAPIGGAPPITSDPPFHHHARRLLLPPFAPKKIEPWEREVRVLCRERLDSALADSPAVIDAATQYAQHIPVTVIGRMLGLPPEDDERFREFVHDALEAVDVDPHERGAAFDRLDTYLDRQIDDHRANPRDDLISYLLDVELFGAPLSPSHVRGSIALLLIAGIDTTWSAIGSSIWHLATHPADRRRLVDEPELMTTAVEEFLRAYAPVTMARMVAKDVEFHGCPMKQEDWVLLPFPAANRDPLAFERADEVLIDRLENRHAAFGLGIHRCLGSNLARLELRVAVEEFLARIPDFELADPSGDGVVWSVGQIRGPRVLPLRIVS